MKTLILYYTEHNGNTEKIAEVFAKKTDAELLKIEDVKDIDIKSYELIGFGSGVYGENLSPKLIEQVNKLDVKGKNVFAFSTSTMGIKSYNQKLIGLLNSKGAKVVGSFSCKGSFNAKEFTENKLFILAANISKGHPNEKDLKKAAEFIDGVMT